MDRIAEETNNSARSQLNLIAIVKHHRPGNPPVVIKRAIEAVQIGQYILIIPPPDFRMTPGNRRRVRVDLHFDAGIASQAHHVPGNLESLEPAGFIVDQFE